MLISLLILSIIILVIARVIENRASKGLPVFKLIINTKFLIINWLIQLIFLSFIIFIILILIFS